MTAGPLTELLRRTRGTDAPRDLLVTSVADFEHRRRQVGTIENDAARNGVVLHDRRRAA